MTTPGSKAIRLIDMVVDKCALAFDKAAESIEGDDPIIWDTFPLATPNPLAMGQIMTGLALFCSIRSTVPGQHLAVTVVLDGPFFEGDQAHVDDFVRDRVDSLLAARAQQSTDTDPPHAP